MKEKIPKQMLNSKYRQEMWRQAQATIKKLEKVLPIASISMIGSFTTAKKKPQDIDVVILLKAKPKKKTEKWSLDFQLVPDNAYGEWLLDETAKWVRRKYGAGKSAVVKIK